MSRRSDYATLTAVAILTAVIILSALFNGRNLSRVVDDAEVVAHTQEVRALISGLETSALEAAMRQRGYLLTGRQVSLDDMEAALAEMVQRTEALRDAVADNRAQRQRIEAWQLESDGLIAALRGATKARPLSQAPDDGVRAIVLNSVEVREQLAPLLSLLRTMGQEEERLLDARRARARRARLFADLGTVSTAAAGLIAFWIVIRMVQRNQRSERAAGAEIVRQRERLRVTLASIGDAVVATDDAGRVTFLNPVAQQLTGWDQEAALGRPLDEVFRIVHEVTREPAASPVATVLRERRIVGLANHTVLISRSGEERPIADSAAPILNEQGAVEGVVLVFRDMTPERDFQERLRAQDAYVRNLVDSTFEGIYSIDLEGRCTFCNPACLKLLGLGDEKEVLGRDMHALIHAKRADGTPLPRSECRIHQALTQGAGVHAADEHFWRADGKAIPVEYWSRPMHDGNRLVGSVVTFHDVSDQRRIDARLAQEARLAKLRGEVASCLATMEKEDEALTACLAAIVRQTAATAVHAWTAAIGAAAPHGPPEERFVGNSNGSAQGSSNATQPLLTGAPPPEARMSAVVAGKVSEADVMEQISLEIEGVAVGVLNVFSPAPLLDDESREIGLLAHQMAQFVLRQRSTAALAENERQFRQWADSIPQLAWMARPDGYVFWYNRRWFDYTGTTLEDMQGWGWQSVHDPRLVGQVTKKFRRCIETGEPWEDTFPLRQNDGEFRWHLSRALPIRDSAGEIVRWFGTNTDVTQQRETEAALRDSEARFRELAEAMPQIVWVTNAQGHALYFNQKWYDYTGADHDERTPLAWESRLHPKDATRVLAGWHRALDEGTPFETEYRLRSRSGEFRWFLRRAEPVRDAARNVVRWVGTSTDIHERRQMADDLQEETRRKDQFLATLAHELRNPLAPLTAAFELLGIDPHNSSQAAEIAELGARQCNQLKRLIDDLLDVSRISSGKIRLQTEIVDLNSIIDSAVESVQPMMQAAGHEFHLRGGDRPCYVEGDRVRLVQIFANLLVNAVKFTPDGGRIELSVDCQHDHVRLTVRDNGIGLTPEAAQSIFNLFVQVDSQLTKSRSGLGIGLTLVKSLVRLHRGTVTVASEGPGRGCDFIVTLPLVAGATAADTETTPPTIVSARKVRRRFAVVDDNRVAATMNARILDKLGQEAQVFYSAKEALQQAPANRPQCIISDVAMPEMSGYDLARALRQLPLEPPPLLVALTGFGQAADREEALRAGFDMHLVKPIGIKELSEVIEALEKRFPETAADEDR